MVLVILTVTESPKLTFSGTVTDASGKSSYQADSLIPPAPSGPQFTPAWIIDDVSQPPSPTHSAIMAEPLDVQAIEDGILNVPEIAVKPYGALFANTYPAQFCDFEIDVTGIKDCPAEVVVPVVGVTVGGATVVGVTG